MISSGIKRGLAVSAVSALSIAGIPALASPASAESINDQVGAANVVLYNSDNTPVSILTDGTDTTVRLEAGAGANFTSVTFQYAIGAGAFQDIATVQRNDDGAFFTEWTPPTNVISQTVTLRASAVPTAGGAAVVSDSPGVVVSNSAASVNLTAASARGVFDTPYATAGAGAATGTGIGQNVRLTGTASGAGTVTLNDTNPDTTAPAATATSVVPTGGTTGTFAGSIDITGYDFAGADELVASAATATEDFEGFTLYNQVVTTVTATADRTSLPTTPAGQTANVVVTVADQNGAPIVGAEVRRASDSSLVGYTDANGQVTTTQGPGTTAYYANATDNDPFVEAEGDKRSADVAITSFTPVITTLVATSRDGASFDFDENIAGDIIVQAKDQFGNNVDVPDAQDLSYYYVLTPFDGSPATVRLPATGSDTVTADTNGAFTLPKLPTTESGTFELFAGLTDNGATPADESTPQTSKLVVKAGQSALTFTGSNPQSATQGTSSAVNGRLALEDGTGLGARSVALTYTQGAAANGTDPTPDAGFTDGADAGTAPDNAVTVTTAADGSFTATVVDPPEAAPAQQGTEQGGTVTANTVAGTVDNDNPAAPAATRTVNFTRVDAPANATVTISTIGTTKPGVSIGGTVTVTTPNATPGGAPVAASGQQVILTLPAASGAFFTDNTLSPAAANGADAGELTSLGKTITVTTDGNGVSQQFFVSIERDTGFDDDGLVEAIVTATAGTAATSPADTEDVDFDSAAPLNGGEVQLVESPAGEQSDGTTPASTNQNVFYDVYTTDQFGNRVGGQNVQISETSTDDDSRVSFANAAGQNLGGGPVTVVSDFDDDGDFAVTSLDADQVTLTATWSAPTTKLVVVAGVRGPNATGTETLTDTAQVTFGDVGIDEIATTLTGNPESQAAPGTAVTETFTLIDDNGDPISGNEVTFTRSGAGGVETVTRTTNANGVATFVFTSAAAGTTTITAEATALGETVTKTDTVVFTTPPPPVREVLEPQVRTGQANGGRTDIFRVVKAVTNLGDVANGATATLFKKVNGRNVRITSKKLDAGGRTEFRIRDLNKKKLTLYFVRVAKTSDTPAGTSPVKKIR